MRLIFLIFSIFYHISLISQCITGTEPSCRCSTAPVLCNIAELDGYSFSTSGYQHPSDGPFNSISSATSYMCINQDGSLPSNTSSDNPTWFAFIAWCDELTIELSYSDCTVENVFFLLGASGLQAAVFSECFDDWDQQSAMPPPYTYSVACDTEYETSFILFTPTSGSRTLNMSGLERGKTYYFLVDGIAGSECGSVDIRVLNDCGIGDITEWSQPIMGPDTICDLNSTYRFYLDSIHPGAVQYEWTVNAQSIITADTLLEVNLDFDTAGSYLLCVDVFNLPCIEKSAVPSPLCKMITVYDQSPLAGDIEVNGLYCPFSTMSISVKNHNANLNSYLFLTQNDTIVQLSVNTSLEFSSNGCGDYRIYHLNTQFDTLPNMLLIHPLMCDIVCQCDITYVDIAIRDTLPPSFVNILQDTIVSCIQDIPHLGPIPYTDNCLQDTLFALYKDSLVYDMCMGGALIRMWQISDACANMHRDTQRIDLIAPSYTFAKIDTTQLLSYACLEDLPSNDKAYAITTCSDTFYGNYTDTIIAATCGASIVQRYWYFNTPCDTLTLTEQFTISSEETRIMCDDGDPCTILDSMTIRCMDVCMPCSGIPAACVDNVIQRPCDDNNECTINDLEIISCQGDICIPCQGTRLDDDVYSSQCLTILIPNIFSPNADGINDIFTIGVKNPNEVRLIYLIIFDRWGNKVYTTTDDIINMPEKGWDGTFLNKNSPSGVYSYILEYEELSTNRKTLSGTLTLIR